jgi:hypothetical protein
MNARVDLCHCAWFAAAVIAILSFDEARAAMIINSFNAPATENFDTFAGTYASVPANFTWTPDTATPNSLTNFERGTFDTATQAYTNNNGLYALLYSTTSSTDRSFGTKRQPNTTPTILTWSFINQTGGDISNFLVSWDVEQYTFGNRATAIDLDYNPNASGATQAGIVGTTLTTASVGGGSGANLPSPTITSRSVSIALATPLSDGQSIDFRWLTRSDQLGTGANAHIGVDNVSVTAVPEITSAGLSVLACAFVGVWTALSRRRAAYVYAHDVNRDLTSQVF